MWKLAQKYQSKASSLVGDQLCPKRALTGCKRASLVVCTARALKLLLTPGLEKIKYRKKSKISGTPTPCLTQNSLHNTNFTNTNYTTLGKEVTLGGIASICFRLHFQQTLRIQIQGSQGCQMIRNFVRNSKILIARSTIQPKRRKIKNNLSFFKEFCWIS